MKQLIILLEMAVLLVATAPAIAEETIVGNLHQQLDEIEQQIAVEELFEGLLSAAPSPPVKAAKNQKPSVPNGQPFKALDEVEPRMPIQQLSGDENAAYVINQSGSYYFTGNIIIDANDQHGIRVDANDVTIDLMGYTLKGPDSGEKSGIYAYDRSNVEIRNGTVRDFGIAGIWGIGESAGHRIIDVRSISNGFGIYLNDGSHLVKDCTVSDNGCGIWIGIYEYGHSTVTGNTVSNNGYRVAGMVVGIFTGYGCTVTGNMVNNNGFSATGSVWGIWAGKGSTVTGNTAMWNGHHVDGNVYGIAAGPGSTVTGNTASRNGILATGDVCGIWLEGNSLVDRNTAYDNNTDNGGMNMNDPCNCSFGLNHAP